MQCTMVRLKYFLAALSSQELGLFAARQAPGIAHMSAIIPHAVPTRVGAQWDETKIFTDWDTETFIPRPGFFILIRMDSVTEALVSFP